MESNDLIYASLINLIQPLSEKGRTESASFLNWLLENIYRLDDVSADDCICDAQNDKGIDGVYVDNNNEEIHFFQSKIRQNPKGTIGDVDLKTFSASVQQFSTPAKIAAVLESDAADKLKSLLQRLEVADLISKGYTPVGVYISNELRDQATDAYCALDSSIAVYDRERLAENYIDSDQSVGVEDNFSFDLSYVEPLEMTISGSANTSLVYVFPARALELVALGGIADTKLFTKNVRYDLGNTAVNRSIRASILEKTEHRNFPLFHNGIIILCEEAKREGSHLNIRNYSVVNGAQSITSFYKSKNKLTDDLRVLVRVIALQDEPLARRITEYSNNQNAIKPRDLRSNHALMTRLQNEMANVSENHFFEIKRGEMIPNGRTVISNDVAGRVLQAFDLMEPWSCHQVYKVFDENFAEIFGRREVDAQRVLFLMRVAASIENNLSKIEDRALAHYGLTKYFLIYVLSRVLRSEDRSSVLIKNPDLLGGRSEEFFELCNAISINLIIDLNFEINEKGDSFDYKRDLKSPKQCEELGGALIRSYRKDLARGKTQGFANW